MPNMLFANNCNTTLNGGISAIATSMVVTSATGFPSPTGSQYFYCTLADAATQTTIEIVKVTAVSGTTFTIVRGQDGTTGTAFASGDVVSLRLVRASLNNFPKLDETNTFTGNLVASAGIDNSIIGATTPTTGKFTTLEATGTSTLGTASTTYVTVTGDASYPMIKATGGTNTPLVLSPLGTGALQAQKTDSTATGGNARGANAVDWQTARSAATQVASGANSFIGGGNANTASGTWGSVVAGSNNANSGAGAIISGGVFNTLTSAAYSFIGAGSLNTINNAVIQPYSFVGAGFTNTANGYLNFVGGGSTNSGTSGSAVTTQSGTMNATTAVTLSGSNASIKVGQYITGTSIAGETYVAAISGTSLTLSKNASGSSTSTLSFFTPHGVVVGGGNNQATGSYSFIGGGGDAGTAANRNVASGDWSFVGGGKGNQASQIGAVVVGGGANAAGTNANFSSGASSFVGAGQGNNASGNNGFLGAGISNIVNSLDSVVIGGAYGTTRGIVGNHIFPACNNPMATGTQGTQQSALLVLARQTTDATATVLTSDTNAASGTNQVALPNNSAYYFKGSVIAGVTGAGNTKGWTIEGVIKRGANAAATSIVGTATVVSTYADAGAATWALTATADTTNGALAITFTGQAATTIRVVAKVETTEMTF